MHSMDIGAFTIHHNGDFSGEVTICDRSITKQLTVPFAVLEELVAEKLRAHHIEDWENATTEELLSLPTKELPRWQTCVQDQLQGGGGL